MIQLAGCAVSAAADGGGAEQNVVCIAHPERGTRMLACDSADSLRAWLAALQTAASGAASPHRRGPRAHPGAAELDARDGAFAHLSRARLSNTLDELRAGALEASRLLLDDDGDERAAARSDPSPAGVPCASQEPWREGAGARVGARARRARRGAQPRRGSARADDMPSSVNGGRPRRRQTCCLSSAQSLAGSRQRRRRSRRSSASARRQYGYQTNAR